MTDMHDGARRFVSARGVVEATGMSASTVRRWSREGKLPSVRTLGGHRRYDLAKVREVIEWLADSSSQDEGSPTP
jgi:putative resolvase